MQDRLNKLFQSIRIVVPTILVCLIFALLTIDCSSSEKTADTQAAVADHTDRFKAKYTADLKAFTASIEAIRSAGSAQDAVSPFNYSRLLFKRIEFLLEYIDSERHAAFNGPPVVKEVKGLPSYNTISPEGLQVIGKMICSGIPDRPAFEAALNELQYQSRLWNDYSATLSIPEADWMEAVLLHLIRIETLSLAGFDNTCTPVPSIHIQEIAASFEAIEFIAAELVEGEEITALYQDIYDRLDGNESLETVSLAGLMRGPMRDIKIMLTAYLEAHEVANQDKPVQPANLLAQSIYDPAFLDASFYGESGISGEDDRSMERKVLLGKRLFHDPVLSNESSLACATCHQAGRYFTDGLALSASASPGKFLTRNTPTLIHSAYQAAYMYDGRSHSLEDQMLHVFTNEKEFHTNTGRIISKLSDDTTYLNAFNSAYPEMLPQAVNLHSLTDALAVYVRTLTGHDSPFDRYMRGEINELPENVLEGFNLFMTKGECGTCHFAPTFAGLVPPFFKESELENIGTPSIDEDGNWVIDKDLGRYDFYENEAFLHFFKTPTLRNVEMTPPYMHNGVFTDLEAVLDFYNNGGGEGHGLNYPNQSLPSDSLGLDADETMKIIEFLKSLTDPAWNLADESY